jgi:hypothetical protein
MNSKMLAMASFTRVNGTRELVNVKELGFSSGLTAQSMKANGNTAKQMAVEG